MKRLNLDETWVLCLRMWKWIAKEVKNGSQTKVRLLKRLWVIKHGYEENELDNDCFFCEYDEKRDEDCHFCPAKKIDSSFHCDNKGCSYQRNPIAFYAKLVELNKKRLIKKRKK